MHDKQVLLSNITYTGVTAAVAAAGAALIFWITDPQPTKGKKYARRDVSVATNETDVCALTEQRWFNCSNCGHYILGVLFFTQKQEASSLKDPESYITICEKCWTHGYNPETISYSENFKIQQIVERKMQTKDQFEALDSDQIIQTALNDEIENQKNFMSELRREREKLGYSNPRLKIYKSCTVIQRAELIQELLHGMKEMFPDIPAQLFDTMRGIATVEVYENSLAALQELISQETTGRTISEYSPMVTISLSHARFLSEVINETMSETLCSELSSPQLWKSYTNKQMGFRFKYPASWKLNYAVIQNIERISFVAPGIGFSSKLPYFDVEQLGSSSIQNPKSYITRYIEMWAQIPAQAMKILEETTIQSHVSSDNDSRPCDILMVEFICDTIQSPVHRAFHGYAALAVKNNRIYVFTQMGNVGNFKSIFDRATIMHFIKSIEFLYPEPKNHCLKIKHHPSGLSLKLPDSPFCSKYIYAQTDVGTTDTPNGKVICSAATFRDMGTRFQIQSGIHGITQPSSSVEDDPEFQKAKLSQELYVSALPSPIRLTEQHSKSALRTYPFHPSADLTMNDNLIIKAAFDKDNSKYILTYQNDLYDDPNAKALVLESVKSVCFESVPSYIETLSYSPKRKLQETAIMYENSKEKLSIDISKCNYLYTPSDELPGPLGHSESIVSFLSSANISTRIYKITIDEPIRSTLQLHETVFFRTTDLAKHDQLTLKFFAGTNNLSNGKVVHIKTNINNITVPGIELQYSSTSDKWGEPFETYAVLWAFVRPEPYADKHSVIHVSSVYTVPTRQQQQGKKALTLAQFLEHAMLHHESVVLNLPNASFKQHQQSLEQLVHSDEKDFSDVIINTI